MTTIGIIAHVGAADPGSVEWSPVALQALRGALLPFERPVLPCECPHDADWPMEVRFRNRIETIQVVSALALVLGRLGDLQVDTCSFPNVSSEASPATEYSNTYQPR